MTTNRIVGFYWTFSTFAFVNYISVKPYNKLLIDHACLVSASETYMTYNTRGKGIFKGY